MAADLATLSLRLTNAQAIVDAKATGAALEDMGSKGEAAARKIAASSNPVTEAIKRQAATTVAATHGMGTWAAIQAEAEARTGAHSIAIGRLERNMASVTERALGLNSTLGLLGATSLKFGVGDIYTVAIVGGLALISAALDTLTASSRKAMETADKLIDSLLRAARIRALGVGGEQKAEIEDLGKGITAYAQRANLFGTLKGMLPGGLGTLLGSFSGGYVDKLGKAATATQESTNQFGEVVAKDNNEKMAKEAAARAKVAAALARQQELLIRYNEMMEKAYGGTLSIAPMTRAQRADWLTTEHARTLSDRESADLTKTLGIGAIPPVSMPNVTIWDGLTKAQQRHIEATRAITERYEEAKKVFSSTAAAVENFKEGIKQAATGLLDKLSPSSIAQGLVQGAINEVDSVIHNLVSGAVTGIRHALFGSSGEERNAARLAADSAKALALGLDAVTQSLGRNALGAAIDNLQIGLISTLQAINTALPGTRNETARNAARDQATRQEAQQEAQLRERFAQNSRYATEDLAVRNLRATGRGSEADLVAFRNEQAREMTQALLDGRDETYRNNLLMVQNNELLAFQNGLLSTALRNAPTGFYGIEAYASAFVTPRGPAGSDSGASLQSSGNGGSTRDRPTTVNLVVDGRVLTAVVIGRIDQFGASTSGAGSSRSDALNRMPLS